MVETTAVQRIAALISCGSATHEKIVMNSDKVRERADRLFKREERAQDGRKAKMEYESDALATREKIARLRALRLAEEVLARSIIAFERGSHPSYPVISEFFLPQCPEALRTISTPVFWSSLCMRTARRAIVHDRASNKGDDLVTNSGAHLQHGTQALSDSADPTRVQGRSRLVRRGD